MNEPRGTPLPRLTMVVTSALSVGFFRGQVGYLVSNGLDAIRAEGARPWALPMEREIAPLKDIVSLWRLWQLFRRMRPDLVVAGTPKAGLLGSLAARLAGVPRVWSTHCVSPSLRARTIGLGLVQPDKTEVVGPGTYCGVDADRFHASLDSRQKASNLRHKLGIQQDAPVIGFVGRFTRDKGIPELYEAFVSVHERHSNLRLLLVGDFEAGDPIAEIIQRAIESDREVIRTGFVPDAAPYYHLMDICCRPTVKGFPEYRLRRKRPEFQ